MRKRLLLLSVIAMCVWACKKTETPGRVTPVPSLDSAELISFKIEAKNNAGKIAADLECDITGDSIIAVVPEMTKNHKWVVTFETSKSGTIVKANDTLQLSGATATDFSTPVTYSLKTSTGVTKEYKVKIKVFTGLPILYITTDGPVVSKDVYVKGVVDIDANVEYDQVVTRIPTEMKGRGNSTWSKSSYLKKPYRLKFTAKAPMLGMPSAKNWVLLANYNDKTLLRNKVAMEMGRRMGADFTPESRFVEVVLNGNFLGNYLLTSQVEIHENRINLASGGFLFELDQRRDADFWFNTTLKSAPITFKDPDAPTTAQYNYLKNYVNEAEAALFSANFEDPVNGYSKYFDGDSFMRWYFVEELMKNQDSRDWSSIYYYKNPNGKIGMGPLWDFDISGGNCDYTESEFPVDWHTKYSSWIYRMRNDHEWTKRFRSMWKVARYKETQQLLDDIDKYAKELELSQKENFKRWPILNLYVYPNPVVLGTYKNEVAYFKNFMVQRIAWIDANINSF